MTKLLSVKPSHKEGKKYDATFVSEEGRTKVVPFGAKGMDDFTKTHDKEQRERYRERHRKDLNTHNPTRPGYLSYYLLWGASPSLRENISTYKRRFNL
jgi:hypothetical protein